MSQLRSPNFYPTVLVVDDHPAMRETLCYVIGRSFPKVIVLNAPDGATARKHAKANRLSIVLMDINLPDANGLDLTREIVNLWPAAMVLVISVDASAQIAAQARRAGAVDFVGKDTLLKEIVPLFGAALSLTAWQQAVI